MADKNQYSSDQQDQEQTGSLGGQATDMGTDEGTNRGAQEEDSDMAE